MIDAVKEFPAFPGVLASLADLDLELVTDPTGAFSLTDIPLASLSTQPSEGRYGTASGRLTVDKAGEIVLRLNPVDGPGEIRK